MALAFSSSDAEVINRKLDVKVIKKDTSNLEELYEVPHCINWLQSYGFKQVCLQFPDEMLKDSVNLALTLEKQTSCRMYILGDTSYGSCCVDEVAAEHVSADAIIHFGQACLSPHKRLPVLYIFGKHEIDCQNAVHEFHRLIPEKETNIVLMYDVIYSHAVEEIAEELHHDYKNLIVSRLNIPEVDENQSIHSDGMNEDVQNNDETSERTIIKKCGRIIDIPNCLPISKYSMFYIGGSSLTLINQMMNFPQCSFFSYDPVEKKGQQEALDVNKLLRKRYHMIEKAKDAHLIGILVGTLGVSNYVSIIKHLKTLIRKAGKKPYTLSIGKLNVAKLANFSEIDVFVLVACQENSLIDSKEFYQPIVTPYELEIALNQARQWTGDYITDFRELLPGASSHVEPECREKEEGDVSLITGKMRLMKGQDSVDNNEGESSLAIRDKMTVASIHLDAAGEHLASRTWKGLEQKLGETPVATITAGKKGIAVGYEGEGSG